MTSKYSYGDIATVRRKLNRVLVFPPKKGYENKAYLEVNGRKYWRVVFPNTHGSRKSPSWRVISALRDDLAVNTKFFDGLVVCANELDDYLGEIGDLL